ncbi:L-cysteine desulfidase family protein [Anaerosalibacter massiliensis]|uniref:L-serine ammonia-lyase, iron-sulfur-dependent, subunit alpha n=1 Tax=Anaerosalibacter massiliensis TaxID=1347392 RepID=A0A9X2S6P3_9FIRM|nr:L-serine ammonia-lyase, iron-sulfur-dependent, subunit alpha [Anaerosalibacter massiliensis]MCR2043847.1 L-serine ammonia-lyase, iron-sulfur-dependent, subunit alpha [Anaerosalibacter massiliensis]
MSVNKFVELLNMELREGLGSTEPASIGLACARASEMIDGEVEKVDLILNIGLFKNAHNVVIPNTNRYGIKLAASLGAVLKNPEKELIIFEDIDKNVIKKAENLIIKDKINVDVKYINNLYIKAKVYGKDEWTEVLIIDDYTNVVKVMKNGEVIFDKKEEKEETIIDITKVTVSEIIEAMDEIPIEKIKFIEKGIDMNMSLAKKAIDRKLGMGVSYGFNTLIKKGIIKNDLINQVCLYTTAASDARMTGLGKSAMTLMGSGNKGVQAIVPVVITGEKKKVGNEKIIRGVAISCLITIYIRQWVGLLSPLCGVVMAAIGASAGITYILGGNVEEIEGAIINMCEGVTGMVCDEVTEGCSLKVRTSTENAIISAYLSMEGVVVGTKNEIVPEKVEDIIENLTLLSLLGLTKVDERTLKAIREQ